MSDTFEMPSVIQTDRFAAFFTKYHAWKLQLIFYNHNTVYFDFSKVTFLEPIAFAFLSAEIDEFARQGVQVLLRVHHDNVIAKWLRNYGILPSISLPDYYERNTKLHVIQIQRCMVSNDGNVVAKQMLPLVLSRISCSNNLKAVLDYSLSELLDNAGTHGYECYNGERYPKPVYACAFSFKQRVEIAVLDLGQGISKSLATKYRHLGEKERLIKAIERGASGHPQGSPGFGLYMNAEVARRGGGRLCIWSNNYGISQRSNGLSSFAIPGFAGSLISLSLDSGTNVPLESIVPTVSSAEDYFHDLGIEV